MLVKRAAMKFLTCLCIVALTSSSAYAEVMRFELGGSENRCDDCGWIQATGEITTSTPADFEKFIHQFKDYPKTLRVNSSGGKVRAAIGLGRILRAKGFATEVGSDLPVAARGPSPLRTSERTKGICVSACAYAFLGGIRRSVDGEAQLGVHRFISQRARVQPNAPQFTKEDLDSLERLSDDLLLYVMEMGVNPLLIALAGQAGAGDIRWINEAEARALRIIYDPEAWKPWRVETFHGGAIAISETNDGKIKMLASCSNRSGPVVVLTDLTQPDESWFKKNQTCASNGKHPVFGTFVDESRVDVLKLQAGGASIRFRLTTNKPPLTSAAIFDPFSDRYPKACTTNRYRGTSENLKPAVTLAFRNCLQDN